MKSVSSIYSGREQAMLPPAQYMLSAVYSGHCLYTFAGDKGGKGGRAVGEERKVVRGKEAASVVQSVCCRLHRHSVFCWVSVHTGKLTTFGLE